MVSYDMGGTTAKICLIDRYVPKTAREFEVARTWRFKKGSGMPISIPVIEMVEIGAGGGSIASVDGLRQLRVGPQSAGSEPGPACYGRGGARPTVTDADLLLGRLDPQGFAGGTMTLDSAAATAAVATHLAEPLALDETSAAYGLAEMVDENMSNAARMHAVESGKDLAEHMMIAFGGAAPLHAARLCEKLGIGALLIPPGAGVGSAIGFLRAPFGFESVRSAYTRLDAFDAAQVNGILTELREEATAFVRQSAGEGPLRIECTAFMRYVGQGWEVPVEIEIRDYRTGDGDALRALFDEAYARLFGRVIDGLGVEIVSWSLRAASEVPPPATSPRQRPERAAVSTGSRRMFDAQSGRFETAAVVERAALRPGDFVAGPAVITERETTTVVTASRIAIQQADGCLLLQAKS
ncbi:hydantoinase/oxoprolinase family protein [Alloyangia mangrovi]|uniref:hydantoinase/oxoprolinase family protein n=1 Tax=Alloyangia mangrovi TaxID=1779329 RepID=UPI002889A12C|nr:hydantoinase/oxoprolinase family protein [Alloyangia mangrovi]